MGCKDCLSRYDCIADTLGRLKADVVDIATRLDDMIADRQTKTIHNDDEYIVTITTVLTKEIIDKIEYNAKIFNISPGKFVSELCKGCIKIQAKSKEKPAKRAPKFGYRGVTPDYLNGKYRRTYAEMREKGFLTILEAANYLSKKQSDIHNYMKDNGLQSYRRGRLHFFSAKDLDDFCNRHCVK